MRLGFLFGEAWTGLRRNASMVVSIVLVTLVSLTFVGTAMLLQLQINQMKSFWYDRAQVAVYLCTDTSPTTVCPQGEANPDQVAAVKAKLEGDLLKPYVERFFFESHEEALKNFKIQFKGNSITKYVTAEQLNETYWVKLNNPTDSPIIIESFSGNSGVEEVRDQRTYLDQIFAILNTASLAAVGIAGLMLLSAALLISTTIRLSALSRRRELGIMRLVGASNFYIQLPFILEGVVAATIGAVAASLAVVGVVQFFVQGYLAQQLPFTSFVSLEQALLVVPLLLLASVVLAGISSWVAIRRYLRV